MFEMREQLVVKSRAMRRLGRSQISGAGPVGALWWYAGSVLYPARLLRRVGVSVTGGVVGTEPDGLPRAGAGPWFSERHPEPVLMVEPSKNSLLVEEFDRLAELYEWCVRPFSTPIFEEALEVMRGYLAPDSRVLDAGCGPGRELCRIASLVPQGEVVGIDLAAGMIRVAHSSARSRGLGKLRVLPR